MSRSLIAAALTVVMFMAAVAFASGLDMIVAHINPVIAGAAQARACSPAAPTVPARSAPGSTWLSHDLPPARFRGDAEATVHFVAADQIGPICAPGLPPLQCGYVWSACTAIDPPRVMTVPNPCTRPDDAYAALLCHELGHVNGWPATHGN